MKLFRQYTPIVYNSNKISTPSSVFVWGIGWLKTATNNHIEDNDVVSSSSPPPPSQVFLAWYGHI